MLFWHLGATLWLFRWIFRDPKVDVRFLFLGAIIPDVVDLFWGSVIVADLATGELWFHSLVIASAYMSLVLVTTRRGRRRRAYMALAVGWMFHLVLDGLWTTPEVLFWPFFGWDLPTGAGPFWDLAWDRAISDPWRWVQETVGVAYLTWLWFATGLNRHDRRSQVFSSGRLPAVGVGDA
jgi:hypothetical protein